MFKAFNAVVNVIFVLFVICAGLIIATYCTDFNLPWFDLICKSANIIAYCVYILSVLLVILGVFFKSAKICIWSLIRGVLSYVIMMGINTAEQVLRNGLFVSL